MKKPNIYKPIKIVETELSQREALQWPSGYEAIRVLVRLHHEPLGYVNLDKREEQADIRARALQKLDGAIKRHLQADNLRCSTPAEIEESLQQPCLQQRGSGVGGQGSEGPFITVAVCTRDRAKQLEGTLAALQAQTYPFFEVLVIDNVPSDSSTCNLVQGSKFKVQSSRFKIQRPDLEKTENPKSKIQNPKFLYLVEERPGLDWARNRAIEEARGEILAYTDDDARPDPDWLEEVARAFADPQVDALTGLVVPAERETPAQLTFEELYGGFSKGFDRIRYQLDRPTRRAFPYAAGKFGAGCNMAFRREIFEQIGFFDEALDVGTATGGGGDMDIFIRVLRGGFTLLYEPRAVVRHLHRRDMAALERQMAGYARSFFAYLFKWAVIDRHRIVDIGGYAAQGWMFWIFIKALLSLLKLNGVPKEIALTQFRNAPLGPLAYLRARRRATQIRRRFGSPLIKSENGTHIEPLAASIIICTDEKTKLEELRDSIENLLQHRSRYLFEVIVVDSSRFKVQDSKLAEEENKSVQIKQVIEEFGGAIKYREEERPGLGYARNAGVMAARYPVLVFLEAGVQLGPGWLDSLVAPFSKSEVGGVSGPVKLPANPSKARLIYEKFLVSSFQFLVEKDYTQTINRGNIAFRARLFTEPAIGPFDEASGQIGGEEFYLGYRVLKAGYKLGYQPDAIVWQSQPLTMSALRRQIFRESKAYTAYRLQMLIKEKDWHLLSRADEPLKRLGRCRSNSGKRLPLHLILLQVGGNLTGPLAWWKAIRQASHYGRTSARQIALARKRVSSITPDFRAVTTESVEPSKISEF